jgi:transcriptional regulator with XRE-family HTH domain
MRRFVALRHKARASQAEIARRAGLHYSTLNAAENGRHLMWPGQLAKLALALDWQGDPAALLDEVSSDDD